ncbi:zinc finger protein ZAT5 [Ricinus communis]|uniref:C2H2-type domain-containing protein n=1 Tax=Ricinus communis TaxID=3988 RepID=B9SCL0_RICCO|nr:zinc finger protein ZAT5 [Ricinus communis]EEF38669.1 conserved hypothetical protein [Ricinus communis]|eukprot:XP_002523729.1 zinc finger protein ZAT5 [Ricinus communis]
MELAQEEFMGSNDLTQIMKGKRTKRQRSSSPHKAAGGGGVSSSSSSGCGDGGGREKGVVIEEYYGSISSYTSCSEVYESTEEEEDMANCLILLAQGDGPRIIDESNNNGTRMEKFSSRKFSQVSTATNTNKAGFYVYECKTCNRSFPSFQALGGHRASHKKPKPEEKKAPLAVAAAATTSMVNDVDHNLEDDCQMNKSSTSSPDHQYHHHHHPLSLQISTINSSSSKGNFLGSNNKAKIHECSICGSEFTSGQALGGHMRRHRANTNNQVALTTSTIDQTSVTTTNSINGCSDDRIIKPRTILSLDLNLPAPEDDHHHREPKFQFAATQQALVFSAAPALVDCHY